MERTTGLGATPEIEGIADQLHHAHEGEPWHGPSVTKVLENVTAAEAATRPIVGAHTIWELVDHVSTWNEVVAMRLAGVNPRVPQEWNFPATPRPTAAAWKVSRTRLARTQARFRAAVVAVPEAKLARRRPNTTTTWYVLIHGQVQHQLYHAGQMALMKRGLGKGS